MVEINEKLIKQVKYTLILQLIFAPVIVIVKIYTESYNNKITINEYSMIKILTKVEVHSKVLY